MFVEINVPDGRSGNWCVESFSVSKEDARKFNLFCKKPIERIEAGNYKRLLKNGNVIMSNTRMEILTHCEAIQQAKGTVLVAGLGLGMFLTSICDKPEVGQIIVVEKSTDVMNLVAPTFSSHPKISIINADIFEWKPEKDMKFDFVWFDIWDEICSDNLKEMTKLKRKYNKWGKIKLCWGEQECRKYLRENKCYGWNYAI